MVIKVYSLIFHIFEKMEIGKNFLKNKKFEKIEKIF